MVYFDVNLVSRATQSPPSSVQRWSPVPEILQCRGDPRSVNTPGNRRNNLEDL